ncbi:MAG TPA: adenylyl-sulfate kinase [bacterium]|nr:adenylyl-sulfate kinase [bacterium]HPS30653.1 adenylyl-sulfate kinase [bacterium]
MMCNTPFVIWFTGLSGSGKSTLADRLSEKLKESGLKCEQLDGDLVRNVFPETGFSRNERNAHIKRMGFLASILERNGIIVIASFISPYEESRTFVRNQCRNFVEVYISTPLKVCEKRDVKGLYKKARKGEIEFFTGVDDLYEVPVLPEITIDTASESVEKSLEQIFNKLISLNLVKKR